MYIIIILNLKFIYIYFWQNPENEWEKIYKIEDRVY